MEGGRAETPIAAQIRRPGERWQRLPLKHPVGLIPPLSLRSPQRLHPCSTHCYSLLSWTLYLYSVSLLLFMCNTIPETLRTFRTT